MTTITEQNGYKIQFNNSSTYFLVDNNGDCYGTFPTERRAKNALKRILNEAGF